MTTTDAEPLSLTRALRAHHKWCADNNVAFDSDESQDRLVDNMPADAADYLRRRAIADAVRAAFQAVEAAGLGWWKDQDTFHIPPANKAAAKPVFSAAFDEFLQG